jgi:hypothetical protein
MKIIDEFLRMLFLFAMFFLMIKNVEYAAICTVFYNLLYKILKAIECNNAEDKNQQN